jgi:hypothetical protein
MAGGADLLARLQALLGPHVRVLAAPCVGRCETAPVAVVHQHPVLQATPAAVQAAVQSDVRTDTVPGHITLQDYSPGGGYELLRRVPAGTARPRCSDPGHAGRRTCGAWAVRAFRPAASGNWCARSRHRG